jgi:hypothetical protein
VETTVTSTARQTLVKGAHAGEPSGCTSEELEAVSVSAALNEEIAGVINDLAELGSVLGPRE